MGHVGTHGSAEPHSWRNKRKCAELSPRQADEIFFPKPGGKSKQAQKYCETCPVMNKCLEEALTLGLVGMWAGTTEGERRRMAKFIGSINLVMPPEPSAKSRRPTRLAVDPNPLNDPLYGLDGPTEADLDAMTEEELIRFGL